MIYIKNLPMWERSLRVGAGVTAAAYTFSSGGTVTSWLLLAIGVGAALTGIFGFCPACALIGRYPAKDK